MDTQVVGAINQVIATIRNIANPIAVLSLVCMGIYMASGGGNSQTVQKVKAWAISLAIGLVLINLAEPIVNWLQTIK